MEEMLNKNNTICLKGFCAIMICLSHIITNDFFKGLYILKDGSFWVGIFLFFSSYGLINNFLSKKDYANNFVSKKFKKIFIPFIIVEIIYMLCNIIFFNIKYSICDIILILIGVKLSNGILWYIQLLLLLNLFLYFTFKIKFITNKKVFINLVLFITFVILVIIDKLIGIDTWWYLSFGSLILGVNVAFYKEKINNLLKIYQTKYKYIIIILTILMIAIATIMSYAMIYDQNILHINNNYFLVLCDLVIGPIITIVFIYLFSFYKGKLWKFIGNISLEIYFYHVLVIQFLSLTFIKNNYLIYTICVILITIGISLIISKIKSSKFINLRR